MRQLTASDQQIYKFSRDRIYTGRETKPFNSAQDRARIHCGNNKQRQISTVQIWVNAWICYVSLPERSISTSGILLVACVSDSNISGSRKCLHGHTHRHTDASGAQRISPLSPEGLVSAEKPSSNLTSRTQCVKSLKKKVRKVLPSERFGVQHNAKASLTGEMVARGSYCALLRCEQVQRRLQVQRGAVYRV